MAEGQDHTHPSQLRHGSPDDSYPAVAQGLRYCAASVGAFVIDPVAQRWYSDVDAKGLVWRETHLNSAGDSYYGDRIVENLRQMFDPKPTLLVAGDSFAAGVGDPNNPTYPYVVANRMGWNLALDAQGGTGFASGIDSLSPPTVPFIDRLDRDAATYTRPCRLRPDRRWPSRPRTAGGARCGSGYEYVKKVRSDWQNAKIVIILPSFPTPVAAEVIPLWHRDFAARPKAWQRSDRPDGATLVSRHRRKDAHVARWRPPQRDR